MSKRVAWFWGAMTVWRLGRAARDGQSLLWVRIGSAESSLADPMKAPSSDVLGRWGTGGDYSWLTTAVKQLGNDPSVVYDQIFAPVVYGTQGARFRHWSRGRTIPLNPTDARNRRGQVVRVGRVGAPKHHYRGSSRCEFLTRFYLRLPSEGRLGEPR